MFPELGLAVYMTDPTTGIPIQVHGRADWGLGYGTREGVAEGTFLGVMEAKQRETFSTAERQLLVYLAMIRELQLQQQKTNCTVQGFFSDGERYCFLAIRNDGAIQRSLIYETDPMTDGHPHLKKIFNFIVTILETLSKSSPHTTPTKVRLRVENEVHEYEKAVWMPAYQGPEELVSANDDLMDVTALGE